MNTWKHYVMMLLGTAALAGCGSDSNNAATTAGPAEKAFVSVAELGEVKSIHIHDSDAASVTSARHLVAPIAFDATIKVRDSLKGHLPDAEPGEIIFDGPSMFVRLGRSGGDSDQIQMIDIAEDGVDMNHTVQVGTRPIHMFTDPDGKTWVLNDGVGTQPGVDCLTDTTGDPGCVADTVSVIAKDGHAVMTNGNITVGSGHHKAAFSKPTDADATIPKLAFVSNIHDDSISVIGNDATDTANYLKVLSTITVGDNPHGIDFSPKSGKIYNANTRDAVNAVSIIDPKNLTAPPITIKKGPGGVALNEVPAISRLHTRHGPHTDTVNHGRYVYILGSVVDNNGTPTNTKDDLTRGKVTVIDTDTNTVSHIIDIPEMRPSRMLFSPDGKRLYLAPGTPFGLQPQDFPTDLQINKLAVIDVDPLSPTAATTFNTLVTMITVGDGGGHGSSMALSSDGHLLFVANAGGTTVSVIDTETNAVVQTIDVGGAPSGIGVTKVAAAAGGHAHP